MAELTIASVNISDEKGTVKKPVNCVSLDLSGICGDAHSGDWHRQISLLDSESIERFKADNRVEICPGDFGENLTTAGLDISLLKPGDRLWAPGGPVLEVTQIGKECHGDACAIYRRVGRCVMPARGVFCRVVTPGDLRRGDILEVTFNEKTP